MLRANINSKSETRALKVRAQSERSVLFSAQCLDFSFISQEQTRESVQYHVLQMFTYICTIKNVCSVRFLVSTLCPEFSKYRFSAQNSPSLRIQQEADILSTLSSEPRFHERSQIQMNKS